MQLVLHLGKIIFWRVPWVNLKENVLRDTILPSVALYQALDKNWRGAEPQFKSTSSMQNFWIEAQV